MDFDPKVMVNKEFIGGALVVIMTIGGLIAKRTKTKKDDKALEAIEKRKGMISTFLYTVAKALLVFRKRK